MIGRSVKKEYEGMIDAYGKAGGDKSALVSEDVARLVIHENRVLGSDGIEGLIIETEEMDSGVSVHLIVEENTSCQALTISHDGLL